MTRRAIVEGSYEIVTGWDPPTQSYFGQVYDLTEPDEDRSIVLWVGAVNRIETLDELATALGEWGFLVDALSEDLERDRAEASSPTPLQEKVVEMFGPVVGRDAA